MGKINQNDLKRKLYRYVTPCIGTELAQIKLICETEFPLMSIFRQLHPIIYPSRISPTILVNSFNLNPPTDRAPRVFTRGHLGHIEGHFRDLFSVQFSRKTFRKKGSKCPKCPARIFIRLCHAIHPGLRPVSQILSVQDHFSTGFQTRNVPHYSFPHPQLPVPSTPQLLSSRKESGESPPHCTISRTSPGKQTAITWPPPQTHTPPRETAPRYHSPSGDSRLPAKPSGAARAGCRSHNSVSARPGTSSGSRRTRPAALRQSPGRTSLPGSGQKTAPSRSGARCRHRSRG